MDDDPAPLLEVLSDALDATPDSAYLQLNMAEALAAMGQTSMAKMTLEQLMNEAGTGADYARVLRGQL